jgi:hypothetical protein
MGRCVSGGLDFCSIVVRPSSASRGVSAMVFKRSVWRLAPIRVLRPVGADFEVKASAAAKGWCGLAEVMWNLF